MSLHWKILIWLAAGILVGMGLQQFTAAPGALPGVTFPTEPSSPAVIESVAEDTVSWKALLRSGDHVVTLVSRPGEDDSVRTPVATMGDLTNRLDELTNGVPVAVELESGETRRLTLDLRSGSTRDNALVPFRFGADLFMRLLKMLIIPLVLTSIISGVAGTGSGKDFGRLGSKTLGYYLVTSLLAAGLGLVLINLFAPGTGANLGLDPSGMRGEQENLWDVLRKAVPTNVFNAFADPANRQMLQVIIFAVLFGFFISRIPREHRDFMVKFFNSAFEVMMALARWVMSLVPYGVFCLLVKVVGETGIGVFKPLLLYMFVIALGLMIHAFVTLPLLLRFVGGVSPIRWARGMSQVLLTAFSTSSSSGTLPVTLETVEEKGGLSNKTASFVLPLGATVNMDGTALYECAGVIFLSQFYASVNPDVIPLGVADQVFVVFMALLASIGAAGIPSAGLVLMVTILSALNMPVEGAALLLAVDRPLDMMRTAVNVWSDSCGAAIIASSEGESFPAKLGSAGPELKTDTAA